MIAYTIPVGTIVYRLGVTNEIVNTPTYDKKWEEIRTTRAVTYAKTEICPSFTDDPFWYIFWLPMSAQPYVMIAVDKRYVESAVIP